MPLYNKKNSKSVIRQGLVAAAANGAVPIMAGTVLITKGSICALTLAAPTTEEDGTQLTIVSTTAYAHTVTQASPGFNGAGGSGDVATFAAAAGGSLTVIAYGGKWYVANLQGVTLA
jgi:hypothetical protein